MKNRWIIALIGVLVVAVTLGVLGGIYLFDDDSSTDSPETSGEPGSSVSCGEAQAVVDASNETITSINDNSEAQDASFFAAILAEQRGITFVMDEQPACFTLLERAGAEGLLEGIRGLLDATISNPVVAPENPVVAPEE